MQITAEIKGLKELQGTLQRLDDRIPVWLAGALNDAAKSIETEIIEETPKGVTGNLQKSWHIEKATVSDLTARVGTTLTPHYAPDVEFGTKPHFPWDKNEVRMTKKGPKQGNIPESLRDWARVKLGNEKAAYLVARKIARKGTKAQEPFKKGTSDAKSVVDKAMNHFVEKVESVWK